MTPLEYCEVKMFTCVDPWAEEAVPPGLRSAALDAEGTVYVPGGWFGCQDCVLGLAAEDGIPVLGDDDFAFVPAWWAAARFPDWDAVLRRYVARIRILDRDLSPSPEAGS
jgi:hypothetical protein